VSREATLRLGTTPACDDARALASLALDGMLVDDVGLRFLRRHLETCAACAGFVAEIGSFTALVRSAPLEPFRCAPLDGMQRPVARAHRAPWVTTATAVAAVVLVVASLPHETPSQARGGRTVAARGSLAPVKLPIGQRSAESDFAAGSQFPRAWRRFIAA
jgi:Putative zinc-finger